MPFDFVKHCACLDLGAGSPPAWQPCASDGFGKSGGMSNEKADWVPVDIKAGAAPNSLVVDLSNSKGVAFGIR